MQKHRLRFDRNEWAGSIGDIGTDLPLLVGMILAAGLDGGSVFVIFGLLQITTGLIFRLPMPVQPLKAMAVLVIAQGIDGATLRGAGIAIGLVMLVLSLSGGLGWLARVVPKCVVRGVQVGLGLKLALLSIGKYMPVGGTVGWIWAGIAGIVLLVLWGNRRVPGGLVVCGLALALAVWGGGVQWGTIAAGVGFDLPAVTVPTAGDVLAGFVLLALPQLPLSLSNSLIATEQTVRDFFPARKVSIKKLGLSYAVVNLLAPWFGGVPVCHGCGGLAGHYGFGGRTGGSVVIYGAGYVLIGLFFSEPLAEVIKFFPFPILGVILLVEAGILLSLARDQWGSRRGLTIAIIVGLLAAFVVQGFLVGMVIGLVVFYVWRRFDRKVPC